MDLFNSETTLNLLPFDGTGIYFGKILNRIKAKFFFDVLIQNIAWKNDEITIFGKHIITKRKTAWYGDNAKEYTYSNTSRLANPWTDELSELKKRVEEITGSQYNACLLNLYHTGEEGMSWHSDNENTISKSSSIASLSFGAERKFLLKHKKTNQLISVILENGSLFEMKDSTQANWLHSLPKTKKIEGMRMNLTFRNMI